MADNQGQAGAVDNSNANEGVTLGTPIPGEQREKRPLSSPESTGFSPPAAKPRGEHVEDKVSDFLAILTDPRVTQYFRSIMKDEVAEQVKAQVSDHLGDIVKRLEFLESKHQSDQTIIADLQSKVKGLENKVKTLEAGQDELEQYGRRNAVRVWINDPEKPGENTDKLVLDLASQYNIPIIENDIGRSHQIGRASCRERV